MKTTKLFLASSSELAEDRQAFELFINRKNKEWVAKGVFLELVVWEDFLDTMSRTRLQDEYNRAIRECRLFVMLYFTKVGQFTEEEFDTAFGQFQATQRPFILTYFKTAPIENPDRTDLQSLWAFQDKLKALGHYQTAYKNIEGMQLHFSQQLDKLAANGFIEFKPEEAEASYRATADNGSAIAQGPNARAVAAGGVIVEGHNHGDINTGTRIDTGGGAYISGSVNTGGGAFIGRDTQYSASSRVDKR